MEKEPFQTSTAEGQAEKMEHIDSPREFLQEMERGVLSGVLKDPKTGADEGGGILNRINKLPKSAKKFLLVMAASTAFAGGIGSVSSAEAGSGMWGNVSKEEKDAFKKNSEAAMANERLQRKREFEDWARRNPHVEIKREDVKINVDVTGPVVREIIKIFRK